MLCVLKEMYKKQYELDMEIASNHHISYEETKEKHLVALASSPSSTSKARILLSLVSS